MSKLDAISAVWALTAYYFAARAIVQPRSVFGDAGLTTMLCAVVTLAVLLS